jgi:hypothetical protein
MFKNCAFFLCLESGCLGLRKTSRLPELKFVIVEFLRVDDELFLVQNACDTNTATSESEVIRHGCTPANI